MTTGGAPKQDQEDGGQAAGGVGPLKKAVTVAFLVAATALTTLFVWFFGLWPFRFE
jgi:hypothetical protein